MKLFWTIFVCLCFTQTLQASTTPAIPASLQTFIAKLEVEKNTIQGCAIAVLYKGHVVYQSTQGYQKGSIGSITPQTLFPVASLSKAITSTAVALMVDRGVIDLRQPITLPELKHAVTLKDILSHTTGYAFGGNSQIESGLSRPQLMAALKAQKPRCKPGRCYTYSNALFSLVDEALILQHSSLHKAIANMRHALKVDGIQLLPLPRGAMVAFPHEYDKKMDSIKTLPFPPYYPKTVPASAGIFASLESVIAFARLSFGYRPDLIAQKTLDVFHTPVSDNRQIQTWFPNWPVPMDKVRSSYAFGWRIVDIDYKPASTMIFHGGMIAGINTFVGFIPAHDVALIILANEQTPFVMKEAGAFWAAFIK